MAMAIMPGRAAPMCWRRRAPSRSCAPASAREAGASLQPLDYGDWLELGGVKLAFAPAGHVLGSAQVVMEYAGQRVVVSGDYKRRPDPTCAPFEPVGCDLFITEATFGLPVFRHPDDARRDRQAAGIAPPLSRAHPSRRAPMPWARRSA